MPETGFCISRLEFTTLSKAGFSVRNPADFPIRAQSPCLYDSISVVLFTVSGRCLGREAALRPEVRPEAHVDKRAHLRSSEVHQRGVTPAPLQGSRLRPERLYLLLNSQHDLAPEGLAKIKLPGQRHGILLACGCFQQLSQHNCSGLKPFRSRAVQAQPNGRSSVARARPENPRPRSALSLQVCASSAGLITHAVQESDPTGSQKDGARH